MNCVGFMGRAAKRLIAEADKLIEREKKYADGGIRVVIDLGFNPSLSSKKNLITYKVDSKTKSQNGGRFSLHMMDPYLFFTRYGARRVAEQVRSYYSARGIEVVVNEENAAA